MPTANQVSAISNTAVKSKPASAYWPLIIILAYYLVSILIVNPIGDFPQNDDWVYGQAAKTFMLNGQIDLPTTCSACILHVCLGGFVAKIFGFSYTALRAITLVFGAISAIAAYFAFVELQVNKKLSCIFTLLYVGNPLVLNLCFSFMTDIPSFAFMNLYFLFVFRGIKRNHVLDYVAASIFLLAAILVRQGTAVFAVANICLLLLYWLKRRNSWTILIGLVVLPIALFVALSHWLMVADKLSDSYIWFSGLHERFLHNALHHPLDAAYAMLVMFGQVACYFGLYLLPILLPLSVCLSSLFVRKVRVAGIWFVLSAATMTASLSKLMLVNKLVMPFNENMLRIPIVGAPNILGISIAKLSVRTRVVLTQVSGFLGFVLLSALGAGLQRTFVMLFKAIKSPANIAEHQWSRTLLSTVVFSGMCISIAAVVLETTVFNVDRHNLLALVPVLMALALIWRWLRVPAMPFVVLPLLVMLMCYSTMASQDNVSWNRARWQAAYALQAQGIKPSEIDGGAEYDFVNDINLWIKTFHNIGRHDNPRNRWRWWLVHDDKYIISFSPVPGYETIATKNYFSALTFSTHQILTLKRIEDGNTAVPSANKADQINKKATPIESRQAK